MEDLVFKALSSYNIPITNYNEAFYVFSCFNLLNTAVKDNEHYKISYDFKKHIEDKIIEVINSDIKNIDIYLDKNVCYIKFLDYQFSFHNVNYGDELKEYKNSPRNIIQEWSGIKLQPIACDIFEIARKRLENEQ